VFGHWVRSTRGWPRSPRTALRDVPALRNYPELVAVLDSWETLSAELSQWEAADGEVLNGVEVLARLRYPRKLICLARIMSII
jgi:hypothetical protein